MKKALNRSALAALTVRRPGVHAESGFTLIEVILAATILTFVSFSVWSTIKGIVQVRNEINDLHATASGTYPFFSRIGRELTSTLGDTPLVGFEKEAADGAPMFGKQSKSGSERHDTLAFVCSTGAQAILSGQGNFGAVQVRYFLVPEQKDGAQFDTGSPERMTLIREELPAGVKDEEVIQKRRVIFPVVSGVVGFRIRYLSGRSWNTDWGSDDTELPDAVDVTLRLQSELGSIDTFRTAFAISNQRTSSSTARNSGAEDEGPQGSGGGPSETEEEDGNSDDETEE